MLLLLCVFIVIALCALLALAVHYSIDKKIVYKNLRNKHVVITGGSSGIGKAAAEEVTRLGAHVTIIGRDVDRLQAAVCDARKNIIEKDQKIQYAVLDITSDYDSIEESFKTIEKELGPIFMLINCAGMCICGQFEKMKVSDIKHMTDLNYFGTAYPTKYVMPGMKERNEGIIVFVSTEAALLGIYGYSAYSAAKWAVRGLAETLFMELVGTGVRLTLAFPPDTDTPGFKNEELTKPKETKLISGSGGLLSPAEVARKMVNDALVGKSYSVFGLTGQIMSVLYCGSIEGIHQVLLQIFSMGILRAVMVGFILSFYKIVRDNLKERRNEAQKTK